MFLHTFWDTRGLQVFYIDSGIPEAYMFFTYILGSQRLIYFYIDSAIPEAYMILHRFWDTRGLRVFT